MARLDRPDCTKNGPAGGGDTIIVKISNQELAQFWYRATGQPTLHGGRLTTDRHTTRISLSVSFSMTKLTKSYIPYVLVHNQLYQLSQSYISPRKPKYPKTFYMTIFSIPIVSYGVLDGGSYKKIQKKLIFVTFLGMY